MAQERLLPHQLILTQRSALKVTGVSEVVHLDEQTVVLATELGSLAVQGRGLHLKTLDPEGGRVALEGEIAALVYEAPRKQGGWRSRLMG